eukprot:272234-Pleurochrysis_carterae.AAC.3
MQKQLEWQTRTWHFAWLHALAACARRISIQACTCVRARSPGCTRPRSTPPTHAHARARARALANIRHYGHQIYALANLRHYGHHTQIHVNARRDAPPRATAPLHVHTPRPRRLCPHLLPRLQGITATASRAITATASRAITATASRAISIARFDAASCLALEHVELVVLEQPLRKDKTQRLGEDAHAAEGDAYLKGAPTHKNTLIASRSLSFARSLSFWLVLSRPQTNTHTQALSRAHSRMHARTPGLYSRAHARAHTQTSTRAYTNKHAR